jgi:Raf kinase inhibitor-like YbhB/YbcL family protein
MEESFVNSLGVLSAIGLLLGTAIAEAAEKFALSSADFGDGQSIPHIYANTGVSGGKNISPQLQWSRPPQTAKSLALVCIDRHPIANNWVHWMVINIPPTILGLPEGASHSGQMPSGSKELLNSFGTIGWGGPQPPRSSGKHQYEFIIYALSVNSLNLSGGTTLPAFDQTIEGKILSRSRLTGTFER